MVLNCQESKDRKGFLDRLDKYMGFNGFKCLSKTHMYEIFLIVYIKNELKKEVDGGIIKRYLPCGNLGPMKFGNKGGI